MRARAWNRFHVLDESIFCGAVVNSDARTKRVLSEVVSVTLKTVAAVLVGTHRATTIPITRTVVIIASFVRTKN